MLAKKFVSANGTGASKIPLEHAVLHVLELAPPLKNLLLEGTLFDYFRPALLHRPTGIFPMGNACRDVIVSEVKALYGEEAAIGVDVQLRQNFIGESGTHLSFPREHDSDDGETCDNDLVWQGMAISASLYHAAGHRFHLGLYSGRIPINNTNGPRYLQVSDDGKHFGLFSSRSSGGLISFVEPISQKKIEDVRAELEQHIFNKRCKQAKENLERCQDTPLTLIESWGEFLSKNPSFSTRTSSVLDKIEAEMSRQGIRFERFDKERTLFEKIASDLHAGEAQSLSDQICRAQTTLINNVLPETIRQVTIDFSKLTQKLIATALRDPNTILHQIFTDPHLRGAFVRDFSNTRAGWKKIGDDDFESPFLSVVPAKEGKKLVRAIYHGHDGSHDPENLAAGLEEGKIVPTIALEIAFIMFDVGLLLHGGMFQCIYATDVQERVANFLTRMGKTEIAQAVVKIPYHLSTQSPCYGINESGGLITFSDLLDQPLGADDIEKIAQIPSRLSLMLAAPTLYDFFYIYEKKMVTPEADGLGIEERKALHRDITQASSVFIDRAHGNIGGVQNLGLGDFSP